MIIEFLAVVAASIYGVLLAARTGMDFVGSFSVAFIAAFGGGTLRDLFLDRTPLFWIGNPQFPITVFAICLLATVFVRHIPRIRPFLIYPDSLGMGLFTASGTGIALQSQDSWFIAILLGTITGTFGGVMADVVCNEVPTLFKPAPLCATCAFSGAALYVFGHFLGASDGVLVSVCTCFVFGFRLLAVEKDWKFPPLRQV